LGYATLGALLMSLGLAYDSDEGRRYAAGVTAIMTGRAYAQSARMAEVKGPFADYESNRESMLGVMSKHRAAAYVLRAAGPTQDVVEAARTSWDEALALGDRTSWRRPGPVGTRPWRLARSMVIGTLRRRSWHPLAPSA